MKELNEMQILAGANQRALDIQVAANQRLQSQVRTLTERLDAVVDAALAKDRELGEMAGRLAAVKDAANFYAYHWYVDVSDKLGDAILEKVALDSARREVKR